MGLLLHLEHVPYGMKADPPPGYRREFGTPAPITLTKQTRGGFNPIPQLLQGTSQPR